MTKTELEKAIKNGESVWIALDDKVERLVKLKWFTDSIVMDRDLSHIITKDDFSRLYKTKAEAEHYLHHANITRTEQLPFLTWEEFNKDTLGFDFTDNIGNKYRCHIVRDYRGGEDFIVLYDKNGTISVDEEWEATEQNFYKAYDECVRLFKGE